MLTRLDRYILKNFLATFVFLLLAFSAIAIVIMLLVLPIMIWNIRNARREMR